MLQIFTDVERKLPPNCRQIAATGQVFVLCVCSPKQKNKLKEMATLKIEIKSGEGRKTFSVSFLVCQGKSKKRIPTGLKVTSSELSANGKRIKDLNKARLIEKMRRDFQDRLDALSLELTGHDMDASEIVRRITLSREGEVLDFFVFAEKWLSETTIKGKVNYVCMINSLSSYIGCRRLPFREITYKFLSGYEVFLRGKPRAQSLYIGQIRHLYRLALREYGNVVTNNADGDPFLRYRVPRQVLRKGVRSLSVDELCRIARYEGTGVRDTLARDCFLLSFCLMGMNTVDMYQCETYRNGMICYNRAKTKDRRYDSAYIEVVVHERVKALVERYSGKSGVFSFSSRYYMAQTFNRNINIGLKVVGKAVGIDNLQFYQARHTFATLSRNMMKFAKSDVDEALNHVGSYDIADVYIKKDFTIINENNMKLLDRIFGMLDEQLGCRYEF